MRLGFLPLLPPRSLGFSSLKSLKPKHTEGIAFFQSLNGCKEKTLSHDFYRQISYLLRQTIKKEIFDCCNQIILPEIIAASMLVNAIN